MYINEPKNTKQTQSRDKLRLLLQGALFIAIAVVLQALRLIIPLPLPVSTFIIGTLVHMMLTLTTQYSGLKAALLMSLALPLFAYAQGQLALPLLIPVVMLGNLIFVLLIEKNNHGCLVILPPLSKAFAMGGSAYAALYLLNLQNSPIFKPLLLAMTVPQFVTGILGIFLANKLHKQLQSLLKQNI